MYLVHSIYITNFAGLRICSAEGNRYHQSEHSIFHPTILFASKILSLLRAHKFISMPNLHKVQVNSSNAIWWRKRGENTKCVISILIKTAIFSILSPFTWSFPTPGYLIMQGNDQTTTLTESERALGNCCMFSNENVKVSTSASM